VQIADDLFTGNQFQGQPAGATLTGAATVKLILQVIGGASGGRVLLTATALTGIVAAGDGGTRAGVTELELPYP
jgi:hypothetical protein